MFTGPVGPVEVFFYWPAAVFGNFYWPGAIGLPLASSPVILNHWVLISSMLYSWFHGYYVHLILNGSVKYIYCHTCINSKRNVLQPNDIRTIRPISIMNIIYLELMQLQFQWNWSDFAYFQNKIVRPIFILIVKWHFDFVLIRINHVHLLGMYCEITLEIKALIKESDKKNSRPHVNWIVACVFELIVR